MGRGSAHGMSDGTGTPWDHRYDEYEAACLLRRRVLANHNPCQCRNWRILDIALKWNAVFILVLYLELVISEKLVRTSPVESSTGIAK